MCKKLLLMTIFFLISFMLSCAQTVQVEEQKAPNIALKDYVPNNQDEEAIADVLQSLSNGWTNQDKQQILSSCHADAYFMDKSGNYVSRADMIIQEVNDWGPPSKAWYGYYDLNIEINGNMANVNCVEMRSPGPFKAKFIMIREKQRWQILKYDWLH